MRSHTLFSSRFLPALLLTFLALFAACGASNTGNSAPKATATAAPVDVYGTPIAMPTATPQRIISLVPSVSEILGALNLQDRVVAVDYYTNYPDVLAAKPKISDANGNFNVENIVALHPDLILSWGAQTKPYDPQLTKLGLHVIDLPTVNFARLLPQIQLVGDLTGTSDAAKTLTAQLQQQIDQVKAKVAGTTAPNVLLEVDDSTPGKPYIFGGGSFGDQLLQYANATNVFHSDTSNGGYPQVTDEAVITANPAFVILTEDPKYGGDPQKVYQRPNWSGIDAVKTHHVYHLNTDLLQRPDPRLVEGLECVARVVHPDKFTDAMPAYCQVNA